MAKLTVGVRLAVARSKASEAKIIDAITAAGEIAAPAPALEPEPSADRRRNYRRRDMQAKG